MMSRGSPHRIALLVGVALLSAVSPLRAETGLDLLAGKSWTADASVRLRDLNRDLSFHNVSWTDESFRSPIYYAIRVSHWPGNHGRWGMALDLVHVKMYAALDESLQVSGIRDGAAVAGTERLADTFSSLSFSHGHNLLLVCGLYRHRLADGESGSFLSRLDLRGGAGIGIAVTHVETVLDGGTTDGYQVTGPAVQGLLGGTVAVSGRFRGLLEYRLAYASIDADLTGGGRLEVSPWSHQLAFGISIVVLR